MPWPAVAYRYLRSPTVGLPSPTVRRRYMPLQAVFVLWEDIVEVRPKMIFSLIATIMGLALAPSANA